MSILWPNDCIFSHLDSFPCLSNPCLSTFVSISCLSDPSCLSLSTIVLQMRFLGSSSVIFIPSSRFKLNKQMHYYMQNTFQIVIVLTMIHKLDLSMVVRLSEVIAQLRGNWTISSGGAENLIFQCQDIIWQSGKSKSWNFQHKTKIMIHF